MNQLVTRRNRDPQRLCHCIRVKEQRQLFITFVDRFFRLPCTSRFRSFQINSISHIQVETIIILRDRFLSTSIFEQRSVAFSSERKFRRATVCRSCLSHDVAPCARLDRVFHPPDIMLRFPVPFQGRPSVAFLLGSSNQGREVMRQHECRRIDRLPWFSSPNRTRLRWASIWFR